MKDSPVSDSSDCTRLTSNLLPVNSNPISDHEVKEVTESCQQCYSVFGLTSENHSTHSHTKHHPAFRAGTLLSVCESHGRLVTRFKYTCGESQSNFRLCSSSWISLLQRHNCEAYRWIDVQNFPILSYYPYSVNITSTSCHRCLTRSLCLLHSTHDVIDLSKSK